MRDKINKTFFLVFLFALSGFMPSDRRQTDQQQKPSYKNNILYQREIEMFAICKLRQADIVMLGNSLVHGANWNELLGRLSVVERGITSDMLEGFEKRMEYVYNLKPKICFIEGGLNDIFNWVPVDEIYASYTRIISGLKAKNIIPVISLTTYVSKDLQVSQNVPLATIAGRNSEIAKLNRYLVDYAARNKIDVINLNTRFATVDNFLRPEYSWDGIHYKASAYKIWAEEVDKILKKYKL